MSLKNFFSEINKGLPSNYLLWSSDSFLLDDAVRTIKHKFGDISEFNFNIFDEETSIHEIVDTARTLPFISPRRFVLIRGFNKRRKNDVEIIRLYTINPSNTTCLVLFYEKKLKQEELKALENIVIIPLTIRDSELPLWIEQRAGSLGITLKRDAVDFLLDRIGPEIGYLASEIEKLSAAGEKVIDKVSVAELIGATRVFDAFDLIRAIDGKDAKRVFKILKNLIDEGEDPAAVIGALNWQFKKTDKKNITVFEELHRADKDIKTSGNPELVLYRLALKLLPQPV